MIFCVSNRFLLIRQNRFVLCGNGIDRDFAVQHIRAGTSKEGIINAFERFKNGFRKEGKIPELWDGRHLIESWISCYRYQLKNRVRQD